MKICKNCGAELPDEAVFCTTCGAVAEERVMDDAPGTSVLADDEETESGEGTMVLGEESDAPVEETLDAAEPLIEEEDEDDAVPLVEEEDEDISEPEINKEESAALTDNTEPETEVADQGKEVTFEDVKNSIAGSAVEVKTFVKTEFEKRKAEKQSAEKQKPEKEKTEIGKFNKTLRVINAVVGLFAIASVILCEIGIAIEWYIDLNPEVIVPLIMLAVSLVGYIVSLAVKKLPAIIRLLILLVFIATIIVSIVFIIGFVL